MHIHHLHGVRVEAGKDKRRDVRRGREEGEDRGEEGKADGAESYLKIRRDMD